MSGGGSSYHKNYETSEILKKIQDAETETSKQEYEIDVSRLLEECLIDFNKRDHEAIKKHISDIKELLGSDIEGVIETRFGGSLSKNTHIDGLSDVDTLVIINKTELADKSPAQVLDYFYGVIMDRYKNSTVEVHKGDLAVTVKFSDTEVQLLPVLRFKTGIKIADGSEWSKLIKPSIFARKLTVLNQSLNGKLIPTIKLIKAIVSKFPDKGKLKGYHIESLAVEIFNYNRKNLADRPSVRIKDMIIKFFRDAPGKLRSSIKDLTGQTNYVDEYLGGKNSINRLLAADSVERISRKFHLADSAYSKSTWDEILRIQ